MNTKPTSEPGTGGGDIESAHTLEQIAKWRCYEKVRQGGRFNMFDPRARQLTGLSRDDYLYCLKNYDALRRAAIARTEPK